MNHDTMELIYTEELHIAHIVLVDMFLLSKLVSHTRSTSHKSQSTTMANTGLGVPVKLLHESLGHIITVELKTGQLYRGKLAEGVSLTSSFYILCSSSIFRSRGQPQHIFERDHCHWS
jgi:hypothetical protein